MIGIRFGSSHLLQPHKCGFVAKAGEHWPKLSEMQGKLHHGCYLKALVTHIHLQFKEQGVAGIPLLQPGSSNSPERQQVSSEVLLQNEGGSEELPWPQGHVRNSDHHIVVQPHFLASWWAHHSDINGTHVVQSILGAFLAWLRPFLGLDIRALSRWLPRHGRSQSVVQLSPQRGDGSIL